MGRGDSTDSIVTHYQLRTMPGVDPDNIQDSEVLLEAETRSVLLQQADDLIKQLQEDAHRAVHGSQLVFAEQYLPHRFSKYYTYDFLLALTATTESVQQTLVNFPSDPLRNTAQEVIAHIILNRTEQLIEGQDESLGQLNQDQDPLFFDKLRIEVRSLQEQLFDDTDVLLLYQDDFEQSEEADLDQMGMVNLHPKNWFKWF